MLVPFDLVQDWLDSNVQPLFAPETFTHVAYSPLILQWQFLTADNIHLAWWRNQPWPNTIDWRIFIIVLSAILVGIIILLRRLLGRRNTDSTYGSHDWLYGFMLCIIAVVLLTYYHTQLTNHETRLAAQRIDQLEQGNDAILHLLPADSQDFANAYHGDLPTYGLVPRGALNDTRSGVAAPTTE